MRCTIIDMRELHAGANGPTGTSSPGQEYADYQLLPLGAVAGCAAGTRVVAHDFPVLVCELDLGQLGRAGRAGFRYKDMYGSTINCRAGLSLADSSAK